MGNKTSNIIDVIKRIEDTEKRYYGCGYSHGKFVINKKTGLVDVPYGGVSMADGVLYSERKEVEMIPIPFGNVKGNFSIKNSPIKSLKNSPRKVGGWFDCSYSDIVNLIGAPEMVIGTFDCAVCKNLESLEGAPREVGRFECNCCDKLKSLKGLPEIIHEGILIDKNLLDPEKNEFAHENKQILSNYTCTIKVYENPYTSKIITLTDE